MAEHKNQHFVPRHYLRAFSPDGGRRIHLCHLKSRKVITDAALKHQCSRGYFYGRDATTEKVFSQMEGEDETLLRQVRDSLVLPQTPKQRAHLSAFATMLHGRTNKAAEDIANIGNTMLQEAARRMARLFPQSAPDPSALPRIADKEAVALSVATVSDLALLTSDLAAKLILAPTAHQFITSDHPTVVINQRFHGSVRGMSTTGLAMRGLQVLLPLSPSVCLMLYDPECYRVGPRKRSAFRLDRPNDLEIINALQVLNADATVYFRNPKVGSDVVRLRNRVRGGETKNADLRQISTPGGGLLFMFLKDDLKLPGAWSFCRMRKHAPLEFGVRNAEITRLYNEWSDQARFGERSFHTWLLGRSAQAT